MNNPSISYLQAQAVQQHIAELHALAHEDRLARLARGPRPLRRRMGRLLIAAGEALARPSPEVVAPESG